MLKGKDITLPTKICIVKAMVFPVVMYGFASWTIKKAELWRIDAFKLCCWRRLWILIGRSNAEAEAPIFWQPDAKSQLNGKYPDAGKDWRWEEKKITEKRWLNSITDLMDMSFSKLQEMVKDRDAWHTDVRRVTKSQTQLSDWTKTTTLISELLPPFLDWQLFESALCELREDQRGWI